MKWLHFFYVLVTMGLATASIKCFAGSSNTGRYGRQQLNVCTSMAYCVTVKEKSGSQSYSCDGNSYNQLALCAMLKPKSSASDYFYATQIGSSSTNARSSRPMVTDIQQHCYNAGDLGTVCCCNTDFCNPSPPFNVLAVIIVSTFLFFI